jgi:glycosyltransferase involved in cell wall biosynthesis
MLSVVLISLNEQDNIARALRSVSWADEILVYDSGSTDRTMEIAKNMGAKVVQGAWQGFGKTKQAATDLASHDWVLSIDCDEEVTGALASEFHKKFPELNPQCVYKLPRSSFYLGTWIRHGGWFPDYQGRLFNRKFARWNQAEIHEKVEAVTEDFLASNLNHYVFRNVEHQVNTNNRYSSLLAKQMHKSGKSFNWFHFLTKPGVKFFENYFLKLGILDGWAGFVIARNSAYSVFLKWTKLREIELRQKAGDLESTKTNAHNL